MQVYIQENNLNISAETLQPKLGVGKEQFDINDDKAEKFKNFVFRY